MTSQQNTYIKMENHKGITSRDDLRVDILPGELRTNNKHTQPIIITGKVSGKESTNWMTKTYPGWVTVVVVFVILLVVISFATGAVLILRNPQPLKREPGKK